MAATLKVDLNCDLGESYGRYKLGKDAEMMPLITSANIACGFHAGDPMVMAHAVSLARQHGVAVGAHPGYPDLQGFGRRSMGFSPEDIRQMVLYQLGALGAFAQTAGVYLEHVKPHGALYNAAAQDSAVAYAITDAVLDFDETMILVGLAGSELNQAGESLGLAVANEGFPDRAYLPDGRLMPRTQPGAVITDPKAVGENALRLVREGINIDGNAVPIDTLCLHGDNPSAVDNARQVRQILEDGGVEICPMRELITNNTRDLW